MSESIFETPYVKKCGLIYSNMPIPLNLEQKKKIFDSIEGGKSLRICDDQSELNLTKMLSRNSASETIQFFGNVNKEMFGIEGIMIKMSFKSKYPKEDNSLEVERKIYRQVTNSLIFNKNTPHVIMYYGTVECDNFNIEKMNYNVDPQFYRELSFINVKYDTRRVRMLLTEKSQGKTINDILITRPSLEDWKEIFFQIIWTLICFGDVGLSHNDLHTGNIFVDVGEPETRTYVYSSKLSFTVKSKYNVKIFDYDRSSKISTKADQCHIVNTRLSSRDCKNFGLCNSYNPKRDITRVLGSAVYVANQINDENLLSLISEIADLDFLKSLYYNGLLCDIDELKRTDECMEIFPDQEVKSLDEALKIVGSDYKEIVKGITKFCKERDAWIRPKKLYKCL